MDFNEYQNFTNSTAIYPKEVGLYYTTMGLVGEAGELANVVKKVIRDDGGELTDAKVKKLVKELGDVLWYASEFASGLGVSLNDVACKNIEKLTSRKERGTLGGSGDDR